MTAPGPYQNEDGDWWVPISAVPNRMKAAHEVRMCMWEDSVMEYVGITRDGRFDTEHADLCAPGEDHAAPDCVFVADAWHFRERAR